MKQMKINTQNGEDLSSYGLNNNPSDNSLRDMWSIKYVAWKRSNKKPLASQIAELLDVAVEYWDL